MELKKCDYIGKCTICGTYAVLNAVGKNISPTAFELSTGVPFGIRCVDIENERLLTPYKDPNIGIDCAAKLWGIPCKKVDRVNKDEAFDLLRGDLEDENNAVVLGPTNMGKLFYIPLCNVYDGVDHYINIRKADRTQLLVTDSEGFLSVPVTYGDLYKAWNNTGVYEAAGKYTYRCFGRTVKPLREQERNRQIADLMYRNMKAAEEEGQGSKAVLSAYYILKENRPERWRLSFLFELEQLIQRKMLAHSFAEAFWGEESVYAHILERQIQTTAMIFHTIEIEGNIVKEQFDTLSCCEKELAAAVQKDGSC